MSSITMTSAPVLPASRPTTRLRITARGRRFLAVAVALPIAIALAWAAVGNASAIASSDAAAAVSFDTFVVLPGDTLWSIAGQIAPASDPREVVDSIIRLNLLNGGAIFAGQELAIPLEYSAGVDR